MLHSASTESLNVNAGLRYQVHTPWTEAHGQQINFEPVSSQPLYPAGTTLPQAVPSAVAVSGRQHKAFYNGYYGIADLEPRIGLANTPPGLNNKVVIRAAYTVSDYMECTVNALRPALNIPFNIETQLNNFCFGGTPGCDPTQLLISNPISVNTANILSGSF